MRFAASVLFVFSLSAQTQVPSGLVRGVLLEPATTSSSGQFSIRAGGTTVYQFVFDSRTWIEKERERVPLTALRKGEVLEVVCDLDDAPLRYARMVHVVEKPVMVRPPLGGVYRSRRSPVEFIAPRGDITFSGIVSELSSERLILRTRLDGEKIIFLRKDTRYLEDGFQVEPAILKSNTRVFLRAGRNLDNELEAYQVIWGEIFEPGSPR